MGMPVCLCDSLKGFIWLLGLLKGVYLVYSNYCKTNIISIDIFVAFYLDI